jgi:hypothetical protein
MIQVAMADHEEAARKVSLNSLCSVFIIANSLVQAREDHNSETNLFRLPRELRDYIWELVFTGDGKQTPRIESATSHTPTQSALLCLCRQIRLEARQYYYRHTVFQFMGPSDEDGTFNFSYVFRTLRELSPATRCMMKHTYFTASWAKSHQGLRSRDQAAVWKQCRQLLAYRLDYQPVKITEVQKGELSSVPTFLEREIENRSNCWEFAVVHVAFLEHLAGSTTQVPVKRCISK